MVPRWNDPCCGEAQVPSGHRMSETRALTRQDPGVAEPRAQVARTTQLFVAPGAAAAGREETARAGRAWCRGPGLARRCQGWLGIDGKTISGFEGVGAGGDHWRQRVVVAPFAGYFGTASLVSVGALVTVATRTLVGQVTPSIPTLTRGSWS